MLGNRAGKPPRNVTNFMRQGSRAADEVWREVRGYLPVEVGGAEEVCGREGDGGAGEESEDEEGAEVVLVRGIAKGGEARVTSRGRCRCGTRGGGRRPNRGLQ